MPQYIKHPFYHNNNHVFSLNPVPLYPEGYFNCDACSKQGNGFSYHCAVCRIDLHLLCASMPLSSSHYSHHHELRLSFFPPYRNNGFSCDVCKNPGSNSWLYRCDPCNFDVHLDCATAKIELTQQSRNITMAKPSQTTTTTTPPPIPRQSPDMMMNIVTRGLVNGGLNAVGQQLVLNMLCGGGGGSNGGGMFKGLMGGGGGSGGGMFQGLMGGGGDGGGSGGEMLQGGGGLDLSSALGGGMDPNSLFGGMDMLGGLGGL